MKYYDDRAIENVGERVDGFKKEECDYVSIHLAQQLTQKKKGDRAEIPYVLEKNSYIGLDMDCNLTGFITSTIRCEEDADLFFLFDEVLTDGKLDYTRNMTSNVVLYRLSGGKTYHLVTAEPYTFKYLSAPALHFLILRLCQIAV